MWCAGRRGRRPRWGVPRERVHPLALRLASRSGPCMPMMASHACVRASRVRRGGVWVCLCVLTRSDLFQKQRHRSVWRPLVPFLGMTCIWQLKSRERAQRVEHKPPMLLAAAAVALPTEQGTTLTPASALGDTRTRAEQLINEGKEMWEGPGVCESGFSALYLLNRGAFSERSPDLDNGGPSTSLQSMHRL